MKTLILIMLLFVSCGKDTQTLHGVPIPKHFQYQATTPRGATVKSVKPIPQDVLTWTDQGLSKTFECVALRKPTWTKLLAHSQYTVLLVEPMAFYYGSNPTLQGAPELITDAGPASATNLGAGDFYKGTAIVAPYQQNWQFVEYYRNSVRFEAEHLASYANDKSFFYQFVGAGRDVHPILPDANGQ